MPQNKLSKAHHGNASLKATQQTLSHTKTHCTSNTDYLLMSRIMN